MKTKKIIALLAVEAIAALYACEKIPGRKFGVISVQLTEKPFRTVFEHPSPFNSVNIDVEGVDVQYSNVAQDEINPQWIRLKTIDGIYDLMKLQDDVTATIAEGKLRAGRISAMRLVLGNFNTVTVGYKNIKHDLILSPEIKSGIILNMNEVVSPNNYLLTVIAFDADKSVVMRDDLYYLNPVIQIKTVIK